MQGLPTVAAIRNPDSRYPKERPWHPHNRYPEYPFCQVSSEPNAAYDMVREALFQLGMDRDNFGSPRWNPLRELIKPGDTVLIKPNMVRHYHGWDWDIDSVITHGSLIRAVVDYAFLALEGHGRLVIGDAPLQSGDFEKILEMNGLREIQQFYRETVGFELELIDFRAERAYTLGHSSAITYKETLAGPPGGYRVVNLKRESFLAPVSSRHKRYRVTQYDPKVMSGHHNEENNEYLIPQVVLDANVVLNMPKTKTHRKAGITNCLKNLVGVNGQKDWLPHHRTGSVDEGGDEYPKRNPLLRAAVRVTELSDVQKTFLGRLALKPLERCLYLGARLFEKERFREGSWYGNDTIWRTVLDLNRALLYADREGNIRNERQRKYFTLCDGILAGEEEGPLEPTPIHCGLVLAGFNPALVDTAAAHFMGFDYTRIPTVVNAYCATNWPLVKMSPEEIRVVSNWSSWNAKALLAIENTFAFKPPKGWRGHLERKTAPGTGAALVDR